MPLPVSWWVILLLWSVFEINILSFNESFVLVFFTAEDNYVFFKMACLNFSEVHHLNFERSWARSGKLPHTATKKVAWFLDSWFIQEFLFFLYSTNLCAVESTSLPYQVAMLTYLMPERSWKFCSFRIVQCELTYTGDELTRSTLADKAVITSVKNSDEAATDSKVLHLRFMSIRIVR